MPYQLPDGRKVAATGRFEVGGVQYPRGWLKTASQAELADLGITWVDPEPTPEQPARPVYAELEPALKAMYGWIEGLGPTLRGFVPTDERLSWDAKLAEAKAYVADPASPTPMLSVEVALTGETVADLAATVVAKGEEYATYAAQIAGLRRATEAALRAATDPFQYETILAAAQTQAEAMLPQPDPEPAP
jgi:hypothetical protein